jgi:hypothetical protein
MYLRAITWGAKWGGKLGETVTGIVGKELIILGSMLGARLF